MSELTRYGVKDHELIEIPVGGVLAPTDGWTEMVEARHYDNLRAQLAAVTKELNETRQWLKMRTDSKWKQEDVVEQLQRQLTAAQAEVARLTDWKCIVEGSGTDQETVIRMKADDYTRTAVQCWKDKVQHLESRTARLLQELQKAADIIHSEFCSDTHHPFCIALEQALAEGS